MILVEYIFPPEYYEARKPYMEQLIAIQKKYDVEIQPLIDKLTQLQALYPPKQVIRMDNDPLNKKEQH